MVELATIAPPDRLELSDLTAQQIEPLERLFSPQTPDTWRDLARSQYVTLLAMPHLDLDDAKRAELAMALTRGIASDMGGTQPYIQSGSQLLASARAKKVIELLQTGMSYKEVAYQCGKISDGRVRQIEAEWVRAQRAARQLKLDLG